jgi:DNA-binding NtrC family response regulator
MGHGGAQPRACAARRNGWRRQDTPLYLGISRKMLWGKMRKYQIFDEEPETRETE